MWKDTEIPGAGRVVVRLAGNRVTEILHTARGETVPIIPAGLTFSFRKDCFPEGLAAGETVVFELPGIAGCNYAVGAGPLFVDDGMVSVDMDAGGWNRTHSIQTQAARMDYTDLRGPRIAAGTDREGHLFLLAINGRIRESVGATHTEMARILQKHGVVKAMGFDPGGSSTLVLDGIVRNISPFNSAHEKNTYALPPEPRAVYSAIIGYVQNV